VTLGIAFVIFWSAVILIAAAVALSAAVRWLQGWLNAPEEPPLPPPNCVGAECVVWQFADRFVDAVPKAEVPEWKRHRYTEINDGKLALTQQLAEAMLLAALADLWQRGCLQLRVQPKSPDPFDPHSLDYEVWVKLSDATPLTPLGRSLRVGFRQATRPVWLLREARDEAALEDLVEFALREVRRCLGWRQASRSSAENLVRYIAHFGRQHRADENAVGAVKDAISALRSRDPHLAQALQNALGYTLLALRRLEPDRDEWGL
jgi:hypothetical protein